MDFRCWFKSGASYKFTSSKVWKINNWFGIRTGGWKKSQKVIIGGHYSVLSSTIFLTNHAFITQKSKSWANYKLCLGYLSSLVTRTHQAGKECRHVYVDGCCCELSSELWRALVLTVILLLLVFKCYFPLF